MNIEEFKGYLQKGPLRNNRFYVDIPLPFGLQNSPSAVEAIQNIDQFIRFSCEAASLPGKALQLHEVRRYGFGPTEKKPVSSAFTDFQIMLMIDGTGRFLKLFEEWGNLIHNTDSSQSVVSPNFYELGYKDDYVVDMRLHVLDQESKIVRTIVLRDAFPAVVGDTPLNWAIMNEPLKIQASITFTDWYEETENNS